MYLNFSWSLSWGVPALRSTHTALRSKPGIFDEKPGKTSFSVEQQDFVTTEKQRVKCKQKKSAIFKVLVIMGETAHFVPTNSWKVKHITDCHHCFIHIPSSYISKFSPLQFFFFIYCRTTDSHWFTHRHHTILAYISSKLNCAAHSSTMKIKAAGFSPTLVMST